MTFYEKLISEATGETSARAIAAIEDCMRHVIFHSTLDWQTKEQLEQGAREAKQICEIVGKL